MTELLPAFVGAPDLDRLYVDYSERIIFAEQYGASRTLRLTGKAAGAGSPP